MVLHGTSSLKEDDLKRLSEDGIIKVNIFTVLARAGGQAVAHTVLRNLGNIFDAHTLEALHKSGTIGDCYAKEEYRKEVCQGDISPKLNELCNSPRRNAWAAAVKREATRFLTAFNYHKFKD